MGPYSRFLTPIFQLETDVSLQVSMLASRMLKAALENTTKLPKKP